MRGFNEIKIGTESLSVGLRPDGRNRLNKPGLVACLNMKPVEGEGLVSQEDYQRIFTDQTFSFPFPQVFKGKGETLLVTESLLYQVDDSLTLSPITVYDAYNPALAAAVPAGGSWHFIDHHTSWMLINGQCVIFKTRKHGLFGETEKVYLQRDVRFQTGCHFRGRAIIGGFQREFFWNSSWEAVWSVWEAGIPGGLSLSERGLGRNYILWSTIGGDLLWLVYPELARKGLIPYTAGGTDTGYDTTETNFVNQMFLDQVKRNELGWMPLDFQGTVIRVEPLGKKVVAYGTDGVQILEPASVEGTSTFGRGEVVGVGLAERGALIAGRDWHRYIGSDGQEWEIGLDGVPKPHNYREYFIGAVEGRKEWAGVYDPSQDEGILSTDAQSFIVTPKGIGESHQLITSGLMHEAEFKVIASSNGQTDQRLVLDSQDFGLRAIKLIQSVEIGLSDPADVFVCLAIRMGASGQWLVSDWVPLNDEGWANLDVSCVEFRLAIKSPIGKELQPSYINYKWNLTDKRNTRNNYAG